MIYAKAVVYLNPSKLAWTSTIPPGKFDGPTVLRHELGHALGLGDDRQCHGLLMCGHHRDPGPHPIDADAMRGIYCLYGWPSELPDSITRYPLFKLLPDASRGSDPCSPWYIYVQGCAGSVSCSTTTLSGEITLLPIMRAFRSLTFVPLWYADNRCTWVAAWYPQPGDPGVEERNGYLYPNDYYWVTVISSEAPPGAWDGYRAGRVSFSGGYPVKCAQQKRRVAVSLRRGRCGYEGRVTVRRIAGGWEVVGLQGGSEVMLVDALGRVHFRKRGEGRVVIPLRGGVRRGFVVVKEGRDRRQVFPVWR